MEKARMIMVIMRARYRWEGNTERYGEVVNHLRIYILIGALKQKETAAIYGNLLSKEIIIH
jgi:hypothetical protein